MSFLDLANNGLGNLGALAIAAALARNTTVAGLWLLKNDIGASGAAALRAGVERNTRLTACSLATLKMSGDDDDDDDNPCAQNFAGLQHVTQINASCHENQFSADAAEKRKAKLGAFPHAEMQLLCENERTCSVGQLFKTDKRSCNSCSIS